MPKYEVRGKIIYHKALTEDVFDLRIEAKGIAAAAVPGQFVSLFLHDGRRRLPRPLSICEIAENRRSLRLVYRITKKGSGTEELSSYKEGEEICLLGPLGKGFLLDREDTLLIGGGIGIPPMLELAKRLPGKKTAVLGYRDHNIFLDKDIAKYAKVYIATEDGSIGAKGNVLELIRKEGLNAATVMACGPTPMLKAIAKYCMEEGIECFLSLEERMACGIGACLACVCRTKERDAYSHVHNARICKEGPVFKAEEVLL